MVPSAPMVGEALIASPVSYFHSSVPAGLSA